jgi:hypothetical protein
MESNQTLRDLAEIEKQIVLLRLEAEPKPIHKKLGSITYPVLNVPFEVTSQIFVRCLLEVQDLDSIFKFPRRKINPGTRKY